MQLSCHFLTPGLTVGRKKHYRALARLACKATLTHEGANGQIAVAFADDAHLRALNHDFRGKDKPTNVLSFPSGDSLSTRHSPLATLHSLGDIILSLDTVAREAKEQGKSEDHHLLHLLVHATLHLLGCDHEEEEEAELMESREISILSGLSVPSPYE